jgi:class 3 adenylate cyclase
VQDVSRIRPLALADRLGVDPEPFVDACLHAAREGLLVLLWDVLCPLCRIPSQIKDTLRELREHGHCEACNLDFKLDFTSSVEMIFRVHPEIRNAELGVYCIGGPVHFPHVVSQVRVAPEERIELPLGLTEGAYRFRGPQLPYAIDFRVHPQARATHWELSLGHGPSSELPRTLKTGVQVLAVTNDHHEELIVRVERTASRKDAVTAARASTLPLFRDLFPGEILSPGQLISVATVTLLVTRLDMAGNLYRELGDARAFGLVHEHFRTIEEHARRESGALVKTVNEGLVLAFHDAAAAVRVALNLQPLLARNEITQQLRLGVGVHRGPALAATLNEQLDYFGTTVNVASQLAELAAGGEVLLTQAVAADPQVAALLQARRLSAEILTASLLAEPECLIHRLAAWEHTVPDRDKVAGVESGQHELAHGLSSVPANGKSEPASTR